MRREQVAVAAERALLPPLGVELDQEALRQFARDNLAAYKVPRRIVVVNDLPKSLIGKVIRRKVKEQLQKK